MKVVQINSTCGTGSVGKICQAVSKLLTENKIDNYILYSRGTSNYEKALRYSKSKTAKLTALKSRVYGNNGFNSKNDTKRLISILNEIKPDIVHIHNIHAHNCDFGMLFSYLKDNRIRVFYTFHDCWAFTGYCMYFDAVNCDKWISGCNNCPQRHKFSWILDRSSELHKRKQEALQGLDLTIITPSSWLAGLTYKSFLKECPIKVINNGIDLEEFQPTKSDFRKRYGCEGKFLILGIASKWEKRKGIDTFVRLSKDLGQECQIILVGTTDKDDKILPNNIISIHRTEGQKELAKIYSAVDVLVNPTMEENFPTVNIESIACGTPVITYDTGGSAEMLDDKSGIVIKRGEYKSLLNEIISCSKRNRFNEADCIMRSKLYSQDAKFQKYLKLYIQ